ncbi:hypothetical protein K435DRAFT_784772 [Dendrothele bispora CBS 962.96]|uniref:ADF-H domain-containing protein n=1 Tax=Dendrothele bispora (strain CBS 962.96) TaxID=1314807 RepID=A0A4S8L1A2_DENBC|nr:hypothetical protein K435DRAFT_784772 [Dendrothele bispora CBS 962.96]
MDAFNVVVDHQPILDAYTSVVHNDSNWFLLKYAQDSDDLVLHGQGTQGLAELKKSLDEPTFVHFGFYREDTKPSGYVLINYVPSLVSAVKKARALVHSRRFAATLIKMEHATLTVDHISNLTPTAIRQAILNPDGFHSIQIERSRSSLDSLSQAPRTPSPMRRSHSDMNNSSFSPALPSKFNRMITTLRRKANKSEGSSTPEDNDDVPPPTPPKDKGRYAPTRWSPQYQHQHQQTQSQLGQYTITSIPILTSESGSRTSLSDFAVISHAGEEEEITTNEPGPSSPQQGDSLFMVPLDKKWISEVAYIPDPTERAQRRILAQRQRELEEEQALREEAERQEQIKLEKQEMMRREEEEEKRRKESLELEIKQMTAERRLREQLAKEQEERERREIEERKQADRRRRLEEHEKLEKWRQEQARQALESGKREIEERKSALIRRREQTVGMAKQVKAEAKAGLSIVEWGTIQTDELVWKRRYLKLLGTKLYMYRSPKDMNQALDEIDLKGSLSALREPIEGFEELEAIPHSFAVTFKDGRQAWAVFGDTEEQKDRLLGMFHYAAGL